MSSRHYQGNGHPGLPPFAHDPRIKCRSDSGVRGLFFLPEGLSRPAKARQIEAAKQVCAGCPLRLPCGRWAVRTRQTYGVWGGLSEDDRQAIWRLLHERAAGVAA